MPVIADKFGKSSIDTDYAVATTVKTTRTAGVTVLEAFDLSKFAAATPVFFVTYKKTTDPVTGVVSVTNLVSWKALVNVGANTLTNLTLAPGYADGGNAVGDFIECIPTSYWENSLIDGIFVGHNPDGSFKTSAVNTALQSILDGGLNTTLSDQLFYTNAIINGGCEVAQRAVPNLSTTYQYGKVDRFAAKATGTAVSAGTINQLTTGLLAATKGYDLQLAGVTITGTGIAFLRYRMESRDAINFVNAAASFGVQVYHNVGSSVNYTVYINKANAADNFSAVTAIANSGAISVPTATKTWLKFENINAGSLGDVSNGLEIEIQIACGAVTTKNFNFGEFVLNKGTKAGAYTSKLYQQELAASQRYHQEPVPAGSAIQGVSSVYVGGTSFHAACVPLTVSMRAGAVLSITGLLATRYGGADYNWGGTVAAYLQTPSMIGISTTSSGGSNGNSGTLWVNAGSIIFDAEL